MGTLNVMIPARLASTRLPRKAMAEVGGLSLVVRAVATALAAEVGGVWVATPDDEIAAEATRHGAAVHRYPDTYQRAAVTESVLILPFLEAHPCEWLVAFNPTSPLIRPETVRAFCEVLRSGQYDTVTSVRLVRTHLVSDTMMPLNFQFTREQRTQDLEHVWAVAWALTGWRARTLADTHCAWCGVVWRFVLDDAEAVDLDTQEDLDYARYLYERRRSANPAID